MTFALPPPSQLYGALAPSWARAGISPHYALETILELVAIAKRESLRPHSSIGQEADTLTWRAWEQLRIELSHELDLPPAPRERIFDLKPGLLEETLQTLRPLLPILSSPEGRPFIDAFLDFLATAPQTAMRDTPIGYFKWPEYMARLVEKLLGKPDSHALYCPFDTSGWMPLFLSRAGWHVRCELGNSDTARILALFAYLGDWKLEVRVGDPIRQPAWLDGRKLMQFKHSAAITSFGLRLKDEATLDPYGRFPHRFHYGETAQVAHLIAQTKGRLVVILPESFLFRTSGGERDYKEKLVRSGILSSVIRLPRDAFAPYANVQSSVLIFETQQHVRDVLFVDASEDLGRKARTKSKVPLDPVEQIVSIVLKRRSTHCSAIASYEQIAQNDFNISADRYVRTAEEQQIASLLEETKTLELADIAEIIRPQAVAGEEGEVARPFAEIGLQDIQPDGTIRQPTKILTVSDRNLGKAERQRVEKGDVLLSVRGRIGAVGVVHEDHGPADWVPSQAFVVLRLRDSSPVRPLALYRYLSSPLGQGLLQSLATGMTVPMVSMGDVKKLRVMVPSANEQQQLEKQYEEARKLRAQIRQLETEAEELNSVGWPMTKVSLQISDENIG